ncbi:glutathione S-transferase family protein [Amaricoccus sp.]|uniref:glutathione S-transferase family protein n=1 Tax=Amaricoccus sp. TaxID=1872485 RepID=UPI002627C894|nr:glutathione S-transferase [uncultured Amaricoccus sp.]
MMDVTLYYAPRSRSLRALWLLEELGIPYALTPLSLRRGEHKSPEMLALNPMGKVPVVTVDGHAVWETPAIIAHLCDLAPEAKLAPKIGTPERADFYRWLSFGTAVMEPAFMDQMKHHDVNPTQAGWGDFASMKAALARGLTAGDWILGKRFSGADILVGGNLAWFSGWARDAFADLPNLYRYIGRLEARPARIRALKIEADLAAREDAGA